MTIDGDRVGKKGEITGGFHDKRRSRLEAARTVQRLEAEFEQESRAVREIQQEIHQVR